LAGLLEKYWGGVEGRRQEQGVGRGQEAGDRGRIGDRDWGRRQGRAILVRHDRVIGAVLAKLG